MNPCTKSQISVNQWASRHPATINFLRSLNNRDIPWSMYCGTAVSLLTGNREPSDTDIMIRPVDFNTVAQLVPRGAKIYRKDNTQFICGDGGALTFFSDRIITFELEGKEVEIMATGDAEYEGKHRYKLGLSSFAIQNRMRISVEDTTLFFPHSFDTMAFKSVLQRGKAQNKHDATDISALYQLYPPQAAYALRRALEMQLDERVLQFLKKRNIDIFSPAYETEETSFVPSAQMFSYVV